MSLFTRALADGDRLDVGGVVVRLKVNARARRVSLRLDRSRREVIATAPTPRRLPEAAAFAQDRAGWIAARIAELPGAQVIRPGLVIQLFGEPCRLEAIAHPARFYPAEGFEPARIATRGEGDAFGQAVIRVIRREALKRFTQSVVIHCSALGVKLPSVTMTDTRGRWGSCRGALRGKPAAIRLSWRLAMATPEVANYVVAHECAHLLELNHSPRFWAHVAGLVGDMKPYRAWLRDHGAMLQAFGGD